MQQAKQTAMKIVKAEPNGAGQHSGPQVTEKIKKSVK